ncbi:MAG: hypothetical protein R3C18_06170 [Planctomycetaceae bacterium]
MEQQELAKWFEDGELFVRLNDSGQIFDLGDAHDSTTASPWNRLNEVSYLERLGPIHSSDFGNEHFTKLKGFERLSDILLMHCGVNGAGFDVLQTLPNLEKLWCRLWHNADESLGYIGCATTLKQLGLNGSYGITDAGMPGLSHLSNLEYLSLQYTSISKGIAVVEQLPSLATLSIVCTAVGDDEMQSISQVKSLEKLYLPHHFTDKGLAKIVSLPNLISLAIGGAFSAGAIADLARTRSLRELNIWNSELDDDAVRELGKLKHLRKVWADDATLTTQQGEYLARKLERCDFRRFEREGRRSCEWTMNRQFKYQEWLDAGGRRIP